ncbi:MAG TPA: acyl-CoA dehydrogenase family protein [Myxococcota bacterium]|nr:acyl-CoA dehydrogenase family protein [Myxococcota bacterium]
MDLSYGPEYDAFRRELRAFLERNRERAPRGGVVAAAGSRDPALLAWQRLLIEHGYAARTVPKQYGGFGAEPDLLVRIILDEEFARAGVSPGLAGQGPQMLVPTLLEHGSEAQRERWIGPTIRGEVVWCQGYSEPGAGSDLANVQTRAVEDGADFVINGQKIWTTTAHLADMMFGLVRTEPGAGKHGGLSYLLIPMHTPGIEVRPLGTMTGHAEFNQVFFTDARVPQSNVVGRRGEGWKIANTTLKHERNALATVGQLEAALARLVELMRQETRDGRRALDDPALRDRLLRLQARVLAMKYHGLRMLTASLRKESPGAAGLVTKLAGCELAHQIAELAIDAMGELGVLYGGARHERAGGLWQLQYMFSLGLIIGGGTAQIQKNIIAERGLGMPREPRAARIEP